MNGLPPWEPKGVGPTLPRTELTLRLRKSQEMGLKLDRLTMVCLKHYGRYICLDQILRDVNIASVPLGGRTHPMFMKSN